MAEDPNTFMLLLRLVLSFGMVLGLVGGVTWLLRRRGLLRPAGQSSPSGRLEVLDRKSLGKNSSLVLARVGDQSMLLGVTGDRIEKLSDAPGLDAAWRLEEGGPAANEPQDAAVVRMPRRDAPPVSPTPATRPGAHLRPATHRTGGARRTGRPMAAPAADRTRMSFVEALQELTVRRS